MKESVNNAFGAQQGGAPDNVPDVSVIVPIYNVDMYLKRCIDSIINQILTNIEIILVNDGSLDTSPQICDDYARTDSRIKVIHKKNGGLSDARNAGIAVSTGRYLAFIDSDDYLIPGGMEEILALTERDFDICIFDSIAVNIDGKELEYRAGCKGGTPLSLEECPELLLEGPDVWNKIFRRRLFTDHNIRFTPQVWFEDLRTIPKLYAFTDQISYVPKALHRYVQRPGSVTNTQKVRRNLEIIPAVDEVIDFYKAQGRYEQLRDVLEYLAFRCVFLTSSVRVNLAD